MVISENTNIKQADAGDVLLISVLATTAFYEAYFEQDDPHDLAGYIVKSFSPSQIENELADTDSTFFIVFVNEKAVGYAKLLANSRDPSVNTSKTIELKRIYVIERSWRKGVGEMLLEHCTEVARQLGNESIWLGVWEQNKRGVSFYAKHGFVKVGTLEFPYGDSVGTNNVLEKRL